MVIQVNFPDTLAIAAREDKINFARKAMIYTLGHLYQEGKISAGIGAEVLGCTKQTFYLLLSEYGFAIIDYDEEEWEAELLSSQVIAQHQPQ